MQIEHRIMVALRLYIGDNSRQVVVDIYIVSGKSLQIVKQTLNFTLGVKGRWGHLIKTQVGLHLI